MAFNGFLNPERDVEQADDDDETFVYFDNLHIYSYHHIVQLADCKHGC